MSIFLLGDPLSSGCPSLVKFVAAEETAGQTCGKRRKNTQKDQTWRHLNSKAKDSLRRLKALCVAFFLRCFYFIYFFVKGGWGTKESTPAQGPEGGLTIN